MIPIPPDPLPLVEGKGKRRMDFLAKFRFQSLVGKKDHSGDVTDAFRQWARCITYYRDYYEDSYLMPLVVSSLTGDASDVFNWILSLNHGEPQDLTKGIEYKLSTDKESKEEGLHFYTKIRYQVARDHNAPPLDLLEYGIWLTRVRNRILTIAGLYHPPLGSTRSTPARFLDQVSELVQYLFNNHKNLVLLGDFNVHVNRLDNQDTQAYTDIMEALGLVQHICHVWQRLPPFPVNLCDLASL